jgi:uncharacterized membrane protein
MDVRISRVVWRWAIERSRGTPEHTLLGVVCAVFAATLLVELAGLDTGLLRPVIVVPFLSLVPGYLLLRIWGIHPSDLTTEVLYSLGLSVCALMIYGAVINAVLPRVGVTDVFREGILFVPLLAGVSGLLWVQINRNDPRDLDSDAIVNAVWQPWTLGLLSVPFVAILGARLVTRFGNNSLILAVLTLLGLIAVAAYVGYLPERFFPLAIWVIAVSLLLHNSVLTHVVGWDAPKELRLATLVVENGVWDASVGGNSMKNAMLRIVLLHPIYAVLSDLSLLWEFKTVAPILFSFAPVAFYKSYQAVVSRRDAFVAVLLPMSFFSFFTVLSWNSRTSGALLFLSLVSLTLVDRSLTRPKRRLLTWCFLFGLVVSHYGTAYIVLAAMGLVLLGNLVIFGPEQTNRYTHTSTVVVLVFGLMVFLWYVFIVYRAGAFFRLVDFSYGFFSDLWRDFRGGNVVSAEDSTTTKYVATQYTSNTIAWLKSLNIVLGALAGLGLAVLGIDHLSKRLRNGVFTLIGGDSDPARIRIEYFLYATAFLGVFGTTFVGVDKLNTARTLMPALLFFAPFVVFTIRKAAEMISIVVGRTSLRRVGKMVVLAVVLSYFILNVGLYGSTTNEYHPNTLIDKGRVMEDGTLAEKAYFGTMHYATIYDLRSQEWLSEAESTGGEYHRFGSRHVIGGMYNCTGVSREPIVRQGTCDDNPALPVDRMDKVYATSGSQIYYRSCGGDCW